MEHAGIAEVKARLSEYLARVRAGEEIVVTDRGRPVARLTPMGEHGPRGEGALEELSRAGIVELVRKPLPRAFWSEDVPKDSHAAARRVLTEEREQGR